MPESLADAWDDLRPPTPPAIVRGDNLDLTEHVRLASTKAAMDLEKEMPRDDVDRFERRFLEHLLGDLRSVSLMGLVKFVLESPLLSADEIRGFVETLPESMLTKLIGTMVGRTTSGVHLLLSLESNRRAKHERYHLTKTLAGGLKITFYPVALNGQPMDMDLTETFETPSTPEPVPAPSTQPSRTAQNISRSRPFSSEDRRPTGDEEGDLPADRDFYDR